MTGPRFIPHHVGVDPGATMGLALVAGDYTAPRPELVFAAAVKDLEELEAIGRDVVTETERASSVDWWVEDWRFARAEARSRQRSWVSLGRSQGAVALLAWQTHRVIPGYLPVSTTKEKGVLPGWSNTLGVPSAKHGDGMHRISEAVIHVAGDVFATIMSVPKTKRPDVAEAILIAAAGWRIRREQHLAAVLELRAKAPRGRG